MVATNDITVVHDSNRLTYADACEIARRVRASGGLGTVRLDLTRTCQTETAALARLVVLRRDLRRGGGDLSIVGLCGRANALYEVNRMGTWLPRREPCAPQRGRRAARPNAHHGSVGMGCADDCRRPPQRTRCLRTWRGRLSCARPRFVLDPLTRHDRARGLDGPDSRR